MQNYSSPCFEDEINEMVNIAEYIRKHSWIILNTLKLRYNSFVLIYCSDEQFTELSETIEFMVGKLIILTWVGSEEKHSFPPAFGFLLFHDLLKSDSVEIKHVSENIKKRKPFAYAITLKA